QGEFYGQSNLRLKISFEGETPGTYRVYTYEWVSEVEYALRSVQFNENDQPTGLFYSGNFVRIHTNEQIQHEIESILNVLDDHEITKEKQIEVYAEDVVHMAPNNAIIYGKEDLLEYLKEQERYGDTDMKHEIIAYDQHGDMIVMQGRVTGVFHPADGGDGLPFQTKNLFIFKRIAGELKIAQVIYNMSPNE
ncbi:MAG: nuclear transport factor 2 family protein, partial [Bacteroidota bacterium]